MTCETMMHDSQTLLGIGFLLGQFLFGRMIVCGQYRLQADLTAGLWCVH